MTAHRKQSGPRHVRIVIRDGSEDDLDDVVGLWKNMVDHHRKFSDYYTLTRNGRRNWSRYLREKFSEPSTKLIVAEEDGGLVGFMLCLLDPKPIFRERTVGLISDTYVVEHRRRKGIMKEMLAVALRWFCKNRLRSAEINVSVANREAKEVWAQLGFKPFAERRRLEFEDEKALALMEDGGRKKKKPVRRQKRSRT